LNFGYVPNISAPNIITQISLQITIMILSLLQYWLGYVA